MARSSPQSFQKRQRERRKQERRDEKFERRLIRNEEKRLAKEARDRGEDPPGGTEPEWIEMPRFEDDFDDEEEGEDGDRR